MFVEDWFASEKGARAVSHSSEVSMGMVVTKRKTRGRWGIDLRCVGFDCRMGNTVPFCEAGWLPNERTRGSDLTVLGALAIDFQTATSRIRIFKTLLTHG
jgi:hypothetical protein